MHAVRADRQRHVICDLVGLARPGQRGAYPLSWVVQRPLRQISDTSLDDRLWPFATIRRTSLHDPLLLSPVCRSGRSAPSDSARANDPAGTRSSASHKVSRNFCYSFTNWNVSVVGHISLIAFGVTLKRIFFAYILASLLGGCTSEHSATLGSQGVGDANDESALARLARLSHDRIKGVPEGLEKSVAAKSASQEDLMDPVRSVNTIPISPNRLTNGIGGLGTEPTAD